MKRLLSSFILLASAAFASGSHEEEYTFYLIRENVRNLNNCNASDYAANELIHLIEEGYQIDPLNMSQLIETLNHANASYNATKVILKAIEYNSPITFDHLSALIATLDRCEPFRLRNKNTSQSHRAPLSYPI